MKHLTWCLGMLTVLFGIATSSARADVINFVGLHGVEAPLPKGYAGFTWKNFSSLNTQTDVNVMPSGYQFADVDSASPFVAFNPSGDPASLSRAKAFSFIG